MSHSRDDETGHVFTEGACQCGLKLKDPGVGLDLIPGHSGNQNFDPAPPGGAVVGSIYTQFECGCRIELRPGDPPIRAFECEHGNSIRAQDPPTGQEVYEYEKWLRTDEAHDYSHSLTTHTGQGQGAVSGGRWVNARQPDGSIEARTPAVEQT